MTDSESEGHKLTGDTNVVFGKSLLFCVSIYIVKPKKALSNVFMCHVITQEQVIFIDIIDDLFNSFLSTEVVFEIEQIDNKPVSFP